MTTITGERAQEIAPYPYNGPCAMWLETHGTYEGIPTKKEWYDSIRERIQDGETEEEIDLFYNDYETWVSKFLHKNK